MTSDDYQFSIPITARFSLVSYSVYVFPPKQKGDISGADPGFSKGVLNLYSGE